MLATALLASSTVYANNSGRTGGECHNAGLATETPDAATETSVQQGQGSVSKQKVIGKPFVCITTLDKFEPDLAMLFDVTAIEVLYVVGIDSETSVAEGIIPMINHKKLKRTDRGFLIQQNDFVKKLLGSKTYSYEIKDGYLIFNNRKYKFINNGTALYDEKKKLTLKIHTIEETKKITNDFAKRLMQ